MVGRQTPSHRESQTAMNEEERLVFTDKGARSIKAGFALIVCSGLIMVAAMAATLFMDVDGAWRATLVIVYTVSGIAGIVLIGRAFATSKRVPDTDEAASGITERELK